MTRKCSISCQVAKSILEIKHKVERCACPVKEYSETKRHAWLINDLSSVGGSESGVSQLRLVIIQTVSFKKGFISNPVHSLSPSGT
jgi:hypothetical protein